MGGAGGGERERRTAPAWADGTSDGSDAELPSPASTEAHRKVEA